jgi:hypothetical protein
MEKDRDSEADELNRSREEIDKELTEEEARQLREERRLWREQIRTAPMDSSILDEPDEPRTRSSSRVDEAEAEAPADAVEAMDQAPLEQKKQPSLPIVNKVVITHVKAKTGTNPSGVPVSSASNMPNPSGGIVGDSTNPSGVLSLKGQSEAANRAYKIVNALKNSTRTNPSMDSEGGWLWKKKLLDPLQIPMMADLPSATSGH